jgi:template-activating factor I
MQQDILPDVFDYFRGIGDNCVDQYDSEDEEDELDEEDGDDDEEIDLEEDPKPKKKQRTQ